MTEASTLEQVFPAAQETRREPFAGAAASAPKRSSPWGSCLQSLLTCRLVGEACLSHPASLSLPMGCAAREHPGQVPVFIDPFPVL